MSVTRNFVAKHMHKRNRAAVMVDRTKYNRKHNHKVIKNEN